jgi:hypothetical protein
MFQYAFAKALAETRRQPLLVDDSFYEQDIDHVDKRAIELSLFPAIQLKMAGRRLASSFYQYNRWDNRLRKIFGLKRRNLVREQSFRYDRTYAEFPDPLLLDGLFQTEKYFGHLKRLIEDTFAFPAFGAEDPNAALLAEIRSCQSIAIHVRRGDYVKYAVTHSFHGTCSTAYYKDAIHHICSRIPGARLFFFSDEPEWVKENLTFEDANARIISINKGTDSWKDMCLMSFCRHNIIANSSFSWWGAWLNKNEEKIVVAPEKWFRTGDPFFDTRDLIPDGWIKLAND